MIDVDNVILGIEGGGTKTTWALVAAEDERVLARGKTSQGNLQVMGDEELERLLEGIVCGVEGVVSVNRVRGIGAAFAGCHLERERERLRGALKRKFPDAERIVVGEDTHSALAGAYGDGDGICVIAGTGSNTFGRRGPYFAKAGGWGHLFADLGSAYDTARRGLQAVYEHYDMTRAVSELGRRFLVETGQRDLADLVPWMLEHSSKTEVAGLARCVLAAAAEGEPMALVVLKDGAHALGKRVWAVARRLGLTEPKVGLIGGMFEHNPMYVEMFKEEVLKLLPQVDRIFVCETPGEIGAVRMLSSHIPLEMNA
ncbi:MAG: hypothetical protein NZM04_04790 [Methylacidiphilales bacterium]|nr:hypothetical protein [Candidatus Methylacidiphilales bacterium]MDW8349729.1 BadF/BadG/BcrA/BcrD ATPase family protein [Verrucomicrobiae bacterium]